MRIFIFFMINIKYFERIIQMKKTNSKILAVSLICMLSFSITACKNNKIKDSSTVVVTQDTTVAQTDSDAGTDSAAEGSSTTTAAIPEKDLDGSKIVTVAQTDASGNAVTVKGGAAATELAIVDEKNNVITNASGSNVPPKLPETTAAGGVIVSTKQTQANGGVQTDGDGPTVSIDKKIEAKAGEEVTFQVKVTKNPGFNAMVAWVDIDRRYFDIVSYVGGDPNVDDYDFSDEKNNISFSVFNKPNTKDLDTIIAFYFDQNAKMLQGDTTYETITLKVKDGTPAGEYDLNFDSATDGKTQCNHINDDKSIARLKPNYVGGSIVVK